MVPRACVFNLQDASGVPLLRAAASKLTIGRLLLALMLAAPVGAAHAQKVACDGAAIALDLSVAATPYVRMRLAGHEGNFLVDTGATYSSVDAHVFGLKVGSTVELQGSSFPTVSGGRFRVLDLNQMGAPNGGQAGVIGTDFLSLRVAEFHYDGPQPDLVVSRQRCPPRAFEKASFVGVSQEGFYSSQPKRLKEHMPDVPVMFIRIGTVTAPAQIDSGYSERGAARGVVQVNEPLVAALRTAGIATTRAGTVTLTDCRGAPRSFELLQVQRASLQMTTHTGETLFDYGPPLLQPKPASKECGGIGGRSEPMGQFGAAYLERWGRFVLDPFNERVWLRKR